MDGLKFRPLLRLLSQRLLLFSSVQITIRRSRSCYYNCAVQLQFGRATGFRLAPVAAEPGQ